MCIISLGRTCPEAGTALCDLGCSSWGRPGLGQSLATQSWDFYHGWRDMLTSCQRPSLYWSYLSHVSIPPFSWVVEETEAPINPGAHRPWCRAEVVLKLSHLGQGYLAKPRLLGVPQNFWSVALLRGQEFTLLHSQVMLMLLAQGTQSENHWCSI